EPVDYSLEIPDSTTIMPNLKSLVCYLKQYQRTGGFLLLKMNKKDTFKDRFGPASTEDLFKQLGALARASLRENDLIARVEDDVLGLFLPDTDMDAGTEFANQLRHTIRHGSFRLHSNESEVMLTASLGYTFCGPTDTPDLVMSRALKTLKSSESRGRNQLFVHSGKSSPRCISSN
ncbi:MAG: GGDEF domain-containing protein, partial [Planctomycetaceae bacterium]|nr:GGDEF domain-containing protein [Planctomycetaceae bacterium]